MKVPGSLWSPQDARLFWGCLNASTHRVRRRTRGTQTSTSGPPLTLPAPPRTPAPQRCTPCHWSWRGGTCQTRAHKPAADSRGGVSCFRLYFALLECPLMQRCQPGRSTLDVGCAREAAQPAASATPGQTQWRRSWPQPAAAPPPTFATSHSNSPGWSTPSLGEKSCTKHRIFLLRKVSKIGDKVCFFFQQS